MLGLHAVFARISSMNSNLSNYRASTVALLRMLGTQLPIIQAPMAGVQGSAMAVAVSNAGGLGSLPCATLTPQTLQSELQLITEQCSAPYNVNFFCHTVPAHDAAHEATWRAALAPFYAEHGVDAASIAPGAGRAPFSHELADVLQTFKPRVVSFHFGLPPPDLLARVKAWGAVVLSSATTVAEARWLHAHGADAIIAQGLEAGGHRALFLPQHLTGDWAFDLSTQMGLLALLPQIVAAVPCPVIAAGGIADAQGVRAAMALGAAGVQVGTAYMLCPEATTSAVHRAALQSTDAQHSALTTLFTGRPARGIVNRVMRNLGPLSTSAPPFPTATAAIAPLRAAAEKQGLGDFSPLWSGQNVSGCKAVPAAQITQELAEGLA
jgi:nitronate monooxygenase